MIKLILGLFSCVGFFLIGVWLSENPGIVQITWWGCVLETSVTFCIVSVFGFVVLLYLLVSPFRLFEKIHFFWQKKTENKAKILLVQILTNILCKNLEPNAKLIEDLQKITSENKDEILLLKALSNSDKEVYKQLIQNPLTQEAGWQGMIAEHIARGEIIKASEEVEELLKKAPKEVWILKEALNVFLINSEWNKAYDCLEKLYRKGEVEKTDYLFKKAVLLVKMNKGMEAFKTYPALPEAAILAAKEEPRKALKIYMKSWRLEPSRSVYRAYLTLFAKENSLVQFQKVEKLCETNETARLNAIVLADAAINARLWNEAKKQLNAYLAMYPLTANVASQMALIENEANHNLREARRWMDKIPSLEADAEYICQKCGHKTDVWSAACPICNYFAGLKIK